jgi:hypothetical protein
MRKPPLQLLALAVAAACNASPPIILQFPPYPAGTKYVSGAVIQGSSSVADYGIQQVEDSVGQLLWFSRFLRRDATGHAYWKLIDSLRLPAYDSARFLVIVGCALRGHPDPEVVALVASQAQDSFRTIFSAWLADRRTERLRLLDPHSGIVCENPGWGAE